MAEIVSLPVSLDREGATQLLAVLSGALADGIDPGPRGPHIRALALSLETLVATLRQEIAAYRALSDRDGPGRGEVLTACAELASHVEGLIDRARAYPHERGPRDPRREPRRDPWSDPWSDPRTKGAAPSPCDVASSRAEPATAPAENAPAAWSRAR